MPDQSLAHSPTAVANAAAVPGTRRRVALHTLGCRLNEAETQLIGKRFEALGYEIVPFGEAGRSAPDVAVINSCTVTHAADATCRKLVRRVLKASPATVVAVVGCYAQVGHEALATIDGLDWIVGSKQKLALADLLHAAAGGQALAKQPTPRVVRESIGRRPFAVPPAHPGPAAHSPTTRAGLPIQDGCDEMCTYCVIPFARGRARPREHWDVQRAAQELVDAGHRELVVTGVNIGTYAHEGIDFLGLIDRLLRIPGLARLRISSIEPTTVARPLIDRIAEHAASPDGVLCPHLHIPLQSGADRILAAMRRHHDAAFYRALIDYAADRIPDAMLATDLIVGFPGESPTDFADSLGVLRDTPLVYAHTFRYSARKGTAATRLDDAAVPHDIAKARADQLLALSSAKRRAHEDRFLGRTVRVLLESSTDIGATPHWRGTTDEYLDLAIPAASTTASPGDLLPVRITGRAPGATPSRLLGVPTANA